MFALRLKHIIKRRKVVNTPIIRRNCKESAINLIKYAIDNKLLSRKSLECISTELCNMTNDFNTKYKSYEEEIIYKLSSYRLSHKHYMNIIGLINDLIALSGRFKLAKENDV